MKSIASVVVVAVVLACAMAMAPQSMRAKSEGPQVDSAATYEHLATAIIAIRETENSLVHGMLVNYLESAHVALEEAADASGTDRTRMLEMAATDITNLANEGDKRIQAIRQKLLKAGHHHHTDAETQDDYMFIDSSEKNALLTLAGEAARMSKASPDEIHAASVRLSGIVDKALMSE